MCSMLIRSDLARRISLTFVLVMSTLVMSCNGSGSISMDVTPEQATISDGQAPVTLQCTLNDADPTEYKIEWSHSFQGGRETLQSNRTAYRDIVSGALTSSLILSEPGPMFVISLYVCEAHSLGRGGNLVTFKQSLVSQKIYGRRLECIKSGRAGRVIHLFQDGPHVDISCKIPRRPIVVLRWKALHRRNDNVGDLFGFIRGDNGVHRYINSSLRWDPRLNGLILYCQALSYRATAAEVEPCIVGLIKVVQSPRIVPESTSISVGLVNEAEFWCDVRGLSRQACTFLWTCKPMIAGCHPNGDDGTLFVGVDATTQIPSNGEVTITCEIQCSPDITGEANATLIFQNWSSVSPANNRQLVSGLVDGIDFEATLELHSGLGDGATLKCAVNMTGYQPTFSWYVDGQRVGLLENMTFDGETNSYYRLERSFSVVMCEVLIGDTIARVWDTFTHLFSSVHSTSVPTSTVSTGTLITFEEISIRDSSIGSYSTYQLSINPTIPSEARLFQGNSRILAIFVIICGSTALIFFLWMAVSRLTRHSSSRKPRECTKTKIFRTKQRRQEDDGYLTPEPIRDHRGVSLEPLGIVGEYAYPAFEGRNPSDFQNGPDVDPMDFLNEAQYEDIPCEGIDSQLHQYQTVSQDYAYATHNPSPESQSASSLSSAPSSSPPLVHEYHIGHCFFPQDDAISSEKPQRIYHDNQPGNQLVNQLDNLRTVVLKKQLDNAVDNSIHLELDHRLDNVMFVKYYNLLDNQLDNVLVNQHDNLLDNQLTNLLDNKHDNLLDMTTIYSSTNMATNTTTYLTTNTTAYIKTNTTYLTINSTTYLTTNTTINSTTNTTINTTTYLTTNTTINSTTYLTTNTTINSTTYLTINTTINSTTYLTINTTTYLTTNTTINTTTYLTTNTTINTTTYLTTNTTINSTTNTTINTTTYLTTNTTINSTTYLTTNTTINSTTNTTINTTTYLTGLAIF
ncbi:uncharacterized protein LOC121422583 [Lytechinus variegatus]|uniref:uncharacterized protein LOC121422583 n=1 Tax=Lytechinus variegatus TaxID=7654 RepID=UPI001BB247EC|nr:uncharacterized protein LOC121422583 [Lytechinus variegatus]